MFRQKPVSLFIKITCSGMVYNVLDIANELLRRAEDTAESELMSNMKLQKMLYYQQGFHLAMFGTPLFNDDVEAWMYGPVVPTAYNYYKAHGRMGIPADKSKNFRFASKQEAALFAEVFRVYGKFSAIGLMNMTHSEAPWKTTKTGEGNVIPQSKMQSFFKTRLR